MSIQPDGARVGEQSSREQDKTKRWGRRWAVVAAGVVGVLACASISLGQRCPAIEIVHPTGAANDGLGTAVAMSGDTMIVGVPYRAVGANISQGSALVYQWTASGWALEATLTASDGVALDHFGYAVAILGDTAIVGSPGHAAYVFVRSATVWTQQAKLTAGPPAGGFGQSVALSSNTAVIGAPDTGESKGIAYVFVRSGTTWTQQAELIASDGEAYNQFGFSLAISGDTAVVGAPWSDGVDGGVFVGKAYVFTRTGSTWTQEARLLATDGDSDDFFGTSVAIAGNRVFVGAPNTDDITTERWGSVYMFERSGAVWDHRGYLSPTSARGDFGLSLAASDSTLIVGAPLQGVGSNGAQGAAYVFVHTGASWAMQAQLVATNGAAADYFGTSVALSGERALIGAPSRDVAGKVDQGSAWVITRCGDRWIGPDVRLLASDASALDSFGYALSIAGDRAIVGAFADDVGANANQGSAYIFERSGFEWIERAHVTAFDGAAGDQFGNAVAILGDWAVVGSNGDDIGANAGQGSAYLFHRVAGTWHAAGKLMASDGAANDYFGSSVAISANMIVVGAYGDDIGSNGNQGSAYVFVPSIEQTWVQQVKLYALSGAANDHLGLSLAIAGETVIVGAPDDDVGANADQGSVHGFVRSGGAWLQHDFLTAADGAPTDHFGESVAISGNLMIVGASAKVIGGKAWQGAAYIFDRVGSTWSESTRLTNSDGAANDRFGRTVAVESDTVVVGAFGHDVGGQVDQGAAYVFRHTGGIWAEQSRLLAPDGAAGDQFGVAVALSEQRALVGARLDYIGANAQQGSAWVFELAQPPTIVTQPISTVLCPAPGATFGVAAVGHGTLGYQWQVESPANSGVYVDLDDPTFEEPATGMRLGISGATAAAIGVSNVRMAAHPPLIRLRCVVSNDCGGATSNPATLTVCAADFNCSGASPTVQDIFDFLAAYFAGDPQTDFNGSGVISVQDIFDFLAAYFAGCP